MSFKASGFGAARAMGIRPRTRGVRMVEKSMLLEVLCGFEDLLDFSSVVQCCLAAVAKLAKWLGEDGSLVSWDMEKRTKLPNSYTPVSACQGQ